MRFSKTTSKNPSISPPLLPSRQGISLQSISAIVNVSLVFMLLFFSVFFSGKNAAYAAEGNNALSFDSVDDYVDCGNNASVQIFGTNISIEAWIYPESFGMNYWDGSIVDKTDNGTYDNEGTGYNLRCGGNGQLDFSFGNGCQTSITLTGSRQLS